MFCFVFIYITAYVEHNDTLDSVLNLVKSLSYKKKNMFQHRKSILCFLMTPHF